MYVSMCSVNQLGLKKLSLPPFRPSPAGPGSPKCIGQSILVARSTRRCHQPRVHFRLTAVLRSRISDFAPWEMHQRHFGCPSIESRSHKKKNNTSSVATREPWHIARTAKVVRWAMERLDRLTINEKLPIWSTASAVLSSCAYQCGTLARIDEIGVPPS